jgi:hypothetical protein
MTEQITEHVEYEKGYLKGFHDGRKWQQEDTHDNKHMDELIGRWHKFVDKHVPDTASPSEQWKIMQSAWETYNGLPFTDEQWRELFTMNLLDLADSIMAKKTNIIQSIATLEAITQWITTIKGKTPQKGS